MLWLATAAALAGAAPNAAPVAAQRPAQAVVRIVRAARIRLGEGGGADEQQGVRRESSVSGPEGTVQPAVLIEFS